MTRRGYVGTLYLNRSSLLLRDTLHRELSPKHLSLFLHERAVARLDVWPWHPTNRPSATL